MDPILIILWKEGLILNSSHWQWVEWIPQRHALATKRVGWSESHSHDTVTPLHWTRSCYIVKGWKSNLQIPLFAIKAIILSCVMMKWLGEVVYQNYSGMLWNYMHSITWWSPFCRHNIEILSLGFSLLKIVSTCIQFHAWPLPIQQESWTT